MARVIVVADTHLRDDGRRWLPASAHELLVGCDAILHAGDVLEAGVLDRLAAEAAGDGSPPPVHAVLGNNDVGLEAALPPTLVTEIGGVRIAMIHASGPTKGRAARLGRKFAGARIVVFGHSHAPCNEDGIDGQLLFNPGSPTQRRAQPRHTIGELVVEGGEVLSHRIIALD